MPPIKTATAVNFTRLMGTLNQSKGKEVLAMIHALSNTVPSIDSKQVIERPLGQNGLGHMDNNDKRVKNNNPKIAH